MRFQKILWGLVIFLILVMGVYGNISHQKANVFVEGEELVYKVKWTFIRVGTIRLVNEGLVETHGGKYYKLRIYIDSAPGIPFITLHDIYESYVDTNAVPVAFYAWEKKSGYVLKTDYLFNHDQKQVRVVVKKIYPDRIEPVSDDVQPMDKTYRDVLSLLFFARKLSGENMHNVAVPTFVLNGKENCYFKDVGEVQQVKYNGMKSSAYYVTGKVRFIGIAGIRDDFEGWFSRDSRRIPLKAKMKAFFGSVTLELESDRNTFSANE